METQQQQDIDVAVQDLKQVVADKTVEDSDVIAVDIVTTVDTYIDLKKKVEALKKKLEPLEKELKVQDEALNKYADTNAQPSEGITVFGTKGSIEVSAKTQSTEITSMPTVVKLLTPELFLKLAKVTLTDLKAHLTGKQIENVTKTDYTGKRRMKVLAAK